MTLRVDEGRVAQKDAGINTRSGAEEKELVTTTDVGDAEG